MNELLEGPPIVFCKHCSMDQDVFNLPCHHLKEADLFEESMDVYTEEMVLTCLYIIRVLEIRFQHSNKIIRWRFHEVDPKCIS